jgi:hypothetical protein
LTPPSIKIRADAEGHPFPIQIAYQTQEFIQGALFYTTFLDLAADETVARPGGIATVEERMKKSGLNAGVTDQGWALLQKYQAVFGGVVSQSVLITLCSHWDWYVRKLSGFILFAREELTMDTIPQEVMKQLRQPDKCSIKTQLDAISKATGQQVSIEASDVGELAEMAQVRNLGLHNRWEIDERYVKLSGIDSSALGELRVVNTSELQRWHSLLIKLLHQTAFNCARSFRDAPPYTM